MVQGRLARGASEPQRRRNRGISRSNEQVLLLLLQAVRSCKCSAHPSLGVWSPSQEFAMGRAITEPRTMRIICATHGTELDVHSPEKTRCRTFSRSTPVDRAFVFTHLIQATLNDPRGHDYAIACFRPLSPPIQLCEPAHAENPFVCEHDRTHRSHRRRDYPRRAIASPLRPSQRPLGSCKHAAKRSSNAACYHQQSP